MQNEERLERERDKKKVIDYKRGSSITTTYLKGGGQYEEWNKGRLERTDQKEANTRFVFLLRLHHADTKRHIDIGRQRYRHTQKCIQTHDFLRNQHSCHKSGWQPQRFPTRQRHKGSVLTHAKSQAYNQFSFQRSEEEMRTRACVHAHTYTPSHACVHTKVLRGTTHIVI